MSNTICRLCLNNTQLMNIFDFRLTNADQLRKCILLATGVEIKHDDIVSKYVCQNCSDLAIFLFKYRNRALANDKALKEYANQHSMEPIVRAKDIAKFNNQILDTLKEESAANDRPKTSSVLCRVEDKPIHPLLVTKPPETVIKKSTHCSNLAVDPTIIQLVKTYPKMKIPNNLLKCDIQPKVALSCKEVDDWYLMRKQQMETIQKREINDMERFRLKCPGISIMKISEPNENKQSSGLSITKITIPVEDKPIQATENKRIHFTDKQVQPIENKRSHVAENKQVQLAETKQIQAVENRRVHFTDKQVQPIENKRSHVAENKQVQLAETKQIEAVENRRVHFTGNKWIHSGENKQLQPIESKQIHSIENKLVEIGENKRVQFVDNKRFQPAENKRVQPVESKRLQPVENKRVQPVENKRVQPVENKQVLPVENKRVQPVENKRVHPVENKRVHLVENKRAQPVENKRVQPVENKRVQPSNISVNERVIDVKSVDCDSTVKTNEKTESLNSNVLKKRKLSESPSDTSKKKKCKEANVSNIDSLHKLPELPSDMSKKKKLKENNTSNIKSSSGMPKKKKLKEQNVPNAESEINSIRKHKPSKIQAVTPVEEQLPKLKIILRTPSLEDVNRPSNSEKLSRDASSEDLFQGFDRVPEQTPKETPQSQESENEKITPVKLATKNLFASDSDQSDNDWMDDNDMTSGDLLDTVEEEEALHCGVCNKIFSGLRQLTTHERSHKECVVCKMIFRSFEALKYHEQDICFKTVIANPPTLQLTKVDKDPNIVILYPNAFSQPKLESVIIANQPKPTAANAKEAASKNTEEVFCISDDDDDDDVILVDSVTTDTIVDEYRRIRRIFQKYRNAKIAHTKQRYTETKLKVSIKINQKNQIVLENMYPELKSYRVPVELVAGSACTASITFSKTPPQPKDIYCWANEPVTKLSERKHLLSMLLNPSPPSQMKYKHILPKTAHPQLKPPEMQLKRYIGQNFKEFQELATISNLSPAKTTPPPLILNKNLTPQAPQYIPSTTPVTSVNTSALKVPLISEIFNNSVPPATPQIIPSTTLSSLNACTLTMPLVDQTFNKILPQPTLPINPSTTGTSANGSTINTPLLPENNTSNQGMQPVEVPQPSTSAVPKENCFSLRVKTPWELNTAL